MMLVDNEDRSLSFTDNEVSVTWFYMTGMTEKEISEWTGLPKKSVSYYKRRMMRKIGVKNNNEFIMWFLENRQSYQSHRLEFSKPRGWVPVHANR